jgi:hypothetical protein
VSLLPSAITFTSATLADLSPPCVSLSGAKEKELDPLRTTDVRKRK